MNADIARAIKTVSAAFLTLVTVSASAQVGDLDLQRELTSFREARSVTTYFIAPGIFFRTSPTESTLEQVGCRSTTSDPEKISRLVDLLEKGNFTSPEKPLGSYEIREGVYFTLPDGRESSILLGPEFVNAPTSGTFERRPIVAASSLPPALRRWAFDIGFTTDARYCIELRDEINNNP